MKISLLLLLLSLVGCARYAPTTRGPVRPMPAPPATIPEPAPAPPVLPSMHQLRENPELALVSAERAAYLRRENDLDKRYFWALQIIESDGLETINPLTRYELSRALPLGCQALEQVSGSVSEAKRLLVANETVRTRVGSGAHLQTLLEFAVYYRCPQYLEALNAYILATLEGRE